MVWMELECPFVFRSDQARILFGRKHKALSGPSLLLHSRVDVIFQFHAFGVALESAAASNRELINFVGGPPISEVFRGDIDPLC